MSGGEHFNVRIRVPGRKHARTADGFQHNYQPKRFERQYRKTYA
jgi:hypothetical protein